MDIRSNFFMFGRMISQSKSEYSRQHPNNVVVFNANICTESKGKIWFGDLDVTKDGERLKDLAAAVGENLFILSEMDGRFENEKEPRLERAVAIVSPTHVSLYEYE